MACGEKFVLPDLLPAPHHPSDAFVLKNHLEKSSGLEILPGYRWPFLLNEGARDIVYCHTQLLRKLLKKMMGSSAEPSFVSTNLDSCISLNTEIIL